VDQQNPVGPSLVVSEQTAVEIISILSALSVSVLIFSLSGSSSAHPATEQIERKGEAKGQRGVGTVGVTWRPGPRSSALSSSSQSLTRPGPLLLPLDYYLAPRLQAEGRKEGNGATAAGPDRELLTTTHLTCPSPYLTSPSERSSLPRR